MSGSAYTQAQLKNILECVSEDERRVEKIVVSAATEYIRSLELPPLKRANPAREIAQLNSALQSMLKALSDLSRTSEKFLDRTRRDPGAQDPSSHDEITDCRALSNCLHRFLIENKKGLEVTVKDGASPGRPKVSAKRHLLERLDFAFAVGHGGAMPLRGRPTFLRLCGSPESMKLKKTGVGNWWDDLDRKNPGKKRRD
jgi:hypothetical protein